jgi:hypothetical protein
MALITYKSQVEFARKHIRYGSITPSGTWSKGSTWGNMWQGIVEGYVITLHTIGEGSLMNPGSFRVRCMGNRKVEI